MPQRLKCVTVVIILIELRFVVTVDLIEAGWKAPDLLEKVQSFYDNGDFAQGRTLLEVGLKRWPRALGLHLMDARLLEAEGNLDCAITALRKAVELFDDNPKPAAALLQACLRGRDFDGATAALALARNRGLQTEPLLRLELALVRARNDWPGICRAAEALIATGASPVAPLWNTLAQARWNTQDAAGAEAAAIKAIELDPTAHQAVLVAAWAATELGEGERAITYYRELARLDPENPRWPLAIVATTNLCGRFREAMATLDEVSRRWPNDPLVVLFYRRSALGGNRLEKAILESPCSNTPDGSHPKEGSRAEEAMAEEIVEMRAVLQKAPPDSSLQRRIVTDSLATEVLVGECPGAKTAVIVFTGLNDRCWMPLSLFDRHLAALGVSAIYVKDFQRLLHFAGVRSLGDSYESTVAALQMECARLGASRICTIGNSAGGAAAVRYGVDLEAARIMSFGGATGHVEMFAGQEGPFRQIVTKRVRDQISRTITDLKPFLRESSGKSKIFLYYGETMEMDRAHAEYLSDLPGVNLCPIAGLNDHQVLRRIAREGKLMETIIETLDLKAH